MESMQRTEEKLKGRADKTGEGKSRKREGRLDKNKRKRQLKSNQDDPFILPSVYLVRYYCFFFFFLQVQTINHVLPFIYCNPLGCILCIQYSVFSIHRARAKVSPAK